MTKLSKVLFKFVVVQICANTRNLQSKGRHMKNNAKVLIALLVLVTFTILSLACGGKKREIVEDVVVDAIDGPASTIEPIKNYKIISQDSSSLEVETRSPAELYYEIVHDLAKEYPNVTSIALVKIRDKDRFGNEVKTPTAKLLFNAHSLEILRQYVSMRDWANDSQKEDLGIIIYIKEDGEWVMFTETKDFKESGYDAVSELWLE